MTTVLENKLVNASNEEKEWNDIKVKLATTSIQGKVILDVGASRDGVDANAFHSRCNNKGPTMIIIQSNSNYLFGSYTAIPWTSNDSYADDSTTFLFTLINPHEIPPSKYLIDPNKTVKAVYH
ncbi:unnamed protein product [Rotaria sp. Silwood1]|nr:unnamed protein product [Rotaria sp. Silwood1]CAF1429710.1 unnamed protein product [Rotaria sp. Silwood1]CAF3567003.1 unnamed protein product [Rotaria sp. Silwood1]CAF4749434.1 unnamed protein product [Rotaria sp. Silwood1]CAF4786594.1 unnamed protein product [Rotaria sp. Silwood1]